MNFKDVSEMPPGMRKLYEEQIGKKERATAAKNRLAELTQETEDAPKESKYHAKLTDRILPDGTVIKFD